MELWVNSADINEIRKASDELNVSGCTTNPKNTATMGGDYKKNLSEICKIVNGPVCAQIISRKCDDMVKEAEIIDSIDEKTLVKIPMGVEGIKAVRKLKKTNIKTNIKVNVTVIFSVAQALLALREGA
jgi:transaldolase